METRKVVAILTSCFNAINDAAEKATEDLEKLMSGDDDGEPSGKKGRDSGRSKKKDDDDDDGDGDEPSEKDVIDAVRAAQKVLDGPDIKKILKKHGKADRASEVEPEHRQAVIDALEEAVEEA